MDVLFTCTRVGFFLFPFFFSFSESCAAKSNAAWRCRQRPQISHSHSGAAAGILEGSERIKMARQTNKMLRNLLAF